MKQTTLASAAWTSKGKVARRERFLAEMDAVIPWVQPIEQTASQYPKARRGLQPHRVEIMLWVHCMQHFLNLSDSAIEDGLYDSEAMRRFTELELVEDAIPDESTILCCRHLLERAALAAVTSGPGAPARHR